MKVLHLNEHLDYRGGIETYLLELLPRLEAEGVETLVAFADGNPRLAPRGAQIPDLAAINIRRNERSLVALRDLLRRERPDIVHLHNIQNVDAVDLCLDSVPTLFTGHDYRYLCPASTFFHRATASLCDRTCGPGCFAVTLKRRCLTPRPRLAWAYYRRVRKVMRNAGRFCAVVAPSRATASRLHAAGFTREQVHVLPYFCPIEPRIEPRVLPDRPHILYIGRLSGNKGWEYFIRALGQLPAAVRGTMVGNFAAESEQIARRLARESGCEDRLTLHSWAGRDRVRELLESASILVFPSIWAETLGIVGLEALASGVPVVASQIGGTEEWLLPNETGLFVPPKDASAIATAVSRLLHSPKEMMRMGAAGIALINARFRPNQHVRQLIDLYEAVAERRPTIPSEAIEVAL